MAFEITSLTQLYFFAALAMYILEKNTAQVFGLGLLSSLVRILIDCVRACSLRLTVTGLLQIYNSGFEWNDVSSSIDHFGFQ